MRMSVDDRKKLYVLFPVLAGLNLFYNNAINLLPLSLAAVLISLSPLTMLGMSK